MRSGLHLYFHPSFGGGERYLLTVAETLQELGPVDFLTPKPVEPAPFEEAFGLDLRGVHFRAHPWRRFHTARDLLFGRRYDFFMALENRCTPLQVALGRRSLLHIQTPPYPDSSPQSWGARLKRRSYDGVVCNSEYTRRWVLRHGVDPSSVRVIYPPVDVSQYPRSTKGRVVLSVGRFFRGRHEKRHDVLIEAFRRLTAVEAEPWELHLAGSIRKDRASDVAYLESLRAQAKGMPVHFHVDASLSELSRLYGEASIYWHAAGYGVDEESNPQFLEHFGMSIVEAMAAGAIPLVYGRGGPVEIVREDDSGFFWTTLRELVCKTRQAMGLPDTELRLLRNGAMRRAAVFSKESFVRAIHELVHGEMLQRHRWPLF